MSIPPTLPNPSFRSSQFSQELDSGSSSDIEIQYSDASTKLSELHLEHLRKSAISDRVIQNRGYRTITDSNELRELGFASSQCRAPGLLLPLHTTDGRVGLYVYRPDNPRVAEDRKGKRNSDGTYPQKILKYELPKDTGVRLDCPPICQNNLANPSIPLWITEGQKKADSLATVGLCAIALLGVWNFKGRNELGGTTFLADWDYIALDGREVRIVFDSDVMTKPQVRSALDRLTAHLQGKGAKVRAIYLPGLPDKGKVGVDDWLAFGHTASELESLVEAPRPIPQPAPPKIELLDEFPITMNRHLMLIRDKAYAAARLPVKKTVSEGQDKNGEIIRYSSPQVIVENQTFVIRQDGVIFGEGGDYPLSQVGFEVKVGDTSPVDKLWSPLGVKAFHVGYRPDPIKLFGRIIDIIDRFIDFDRSLADQRTMSEFIACYVLATWFLDAFNVIGFLWANGERGSGKTNLLMVVAELSYLGQVILSGGSFASLRDLADDGATLAFDDAESFSNPKTGDPEKRTLLLAGNRRGATVPLKEPDGPRGWRIRQVNTYCPRIFSAIHLPDPVLSSRSIIVPLIRTPDRERANTDPADFEAWPHDRRILIDDLWALATSRLSDLRYFDKWVGKNARLTARSLQPWRGVLAIAAWLDQMGVTDLWRRMEQLSVNYQTERQEIEFFDLTILVIQAIVKCAVSAIRSNGAITQEIFSWTLSVAQISQMAATIAEQDEWDIDANYITNRRVGRVLTRLRLREQPRQGGKGSRQRVITPYELERLASSYNISLPEELEKILGDDMQRQSAIGTNGTNGSNGTDVSSCDAIGQSSSSSVDKPIADAGPLQSIEWSYKAKAYLDARYDGPYSNQPCISCNEMNWVSYPKGSGVYCGTCHPQSVNHSGE